MSRFELLQLTVTSDDDATGLRQIASKTTRSLGADQATATRVATSVSELARVAQQHLPATITFALDRDEPPTLCVTMTFPRDEVPPDLAPARPAFTAMSRLMDAVLIVPGGIELRKAVPVDTDDAQLEAIRQELINEPPGEIRALLQTQNAELLAALVALRERELELVQLNQELDTTNRGVVALYAELEQRSREVRTAQRAVFEELERALRPPPPLVPGLDLGVRYLPAQDNSPTGGDLYDWFTMPDGTLHITVVDIQGHGVLGTRDALLVTHTIRTLSLEGRPLEHLLAQADALLQQDPRDVTATVLLARIQPVTGRLELASAGHPPALLIPTKLEPGASLPPTASYVDAIGRPIGYLDAGSDTVSSLSLKPDDTVLLYTDGLIEIRKDLIEGMATLESAASKAALLSLPQMLDTILAACTLGDPLLDDTLLLAARWRPEVRFDES